ncbi:hypothetical protein BS47DRAFT_1400209 [Hydnum rufescens UP504]|uniref:Uncharacterized protein n=1 Tax=Hydnum rufescens UP504 TaxID=1448309 RepID=A0A9P6AH14_9AGAM|nr:hypothetical protein BS47DRAFT_1400209 [Hydnum rufescens UP504]
MPAPLRDLGWQGSSNPWDDIDNISRWRVSGAFYFWQGLEQQLAQQLLIQFQEHLTLQTSLQFLHWIPLGYIFEMEPAESSPLSQFLEPPEYWNVTLKCLSEVAGLNVALNTHSLISKIPPSTDIVKAYATSSDLDQELVLNLTLFLSNFRSNHLCAIGNPANNDVLLSAHLYMVKISTVNEQEVFKICLEYWSRLMALYEELQSLPNADLVGLHLGTSTGVPLGVTLWGNIHSYVPSNLRLELWKRKAVCLVPLYSLSLSALHTLHARFPATPIFGSGGTPTSAGAPELMRHPAQHQPI